MNTPDNAESLEAVPGQIVGGKWRIVALIGRGGMGAVYEGQNISIGKKVALKFIDAEFARQPDIASRFQREAEAASLVESAHIVHIFDSGVTDTGVPYIVMELLRGEDLRARLRRLGKLPNEEAVKIVAQTLRGLHRAHEAGIVHRDLKPDNIFLVDRDDDALFAKIVDFGISKMTRRSGEVGTGTLTRQGVVLGTPYYMSPEQAQALPNLDVRTDLWSVGAILYECLAGRPPHLGDTYEQIIISICTTDAPDLRSIDPTVPAPLAAVVHRALTRDKARRYQSAKEMLEALELTGLVRSLHGATPPPLSSAQHVAPNVAASSGASAVGAMEGAGARTRVSWTKGEPKAIAIADTIVDTDERTVRARGVRRRGLVALGLAVTGAAFVLTYGVLRAQRSPHRTTAPLKPSIALSSPNAPPLASGPLVDAPAAKAPDNTDEHPAESAEAVHAPVNHAPTAAPGKPKRAAPAGASLSTANVSTPAPPPPSATPAKTGGVAGGLQIKTTYP